MRPDLDLEEEDRFFISGVEKVGRSRQTYDLQLRKRKIIVGVAIGVGSLALVALILGLAWGLGHRKISYACPRTFKASDGNLVFYVVGDWGRANDNQKKAARIMADVSKCMPPSFVVSTGDNFYPHGLQSAADPAFTASFTKMYKAPGLQVPWYAVMGNHDYGDSVDMELLASGECLKAPTSPVECVGKCCISPWWQIVPELAAQDPRWNATMGGVVTRRFDLAAGRTLDIIFVDTVPIIYQYQTKPWATFLYGFNSQNSDAIKEQLLQQLNASYVSGSTWRVVVGHHPVRSYGSHCTQANAYDCADMAFIRPWLKRYKVAAYINGHDHDQQLIKSADDPVHYVVSGAGSDTREGEFDDIDPEVRSQDALFLSDRQGFVAVVMAGTTMRLHFYTDDQTAPAYTRVVTLPDW